MPVADQDPGVIISRKAYQRIAGYSWRHANMALDVKHWHEVYGVLVGFVYQNRLVVVQDAIPMVVGSRAGVQFEDKQYVDAATIDQEIYERGLADPAKKHYFFCGWWHTHPGFSFFYSEVDTLTHLGYQMANPHAIGLIYDHTERSTFHPGIECLHLTDPDRGVLSDYEFVDFALQDLEHSIQSAEHVETRLAAEIEHVTGLIAEIQQVLIKKRFAQLQRNYGLLLVPKYLSKATKKALTEGLEDEELWVWDDRVLQAQYRMPKFRAKFQDHLDDLPRKPKKCCKLLERMQAALARSHERWDDICREFHEALRQIAPYYWYLDTNERQIVERLDERLCKYYKVLKPLQERVAVSLAATRHRLARREV